MGDRLTPMGGIAKIPAENRKVSFVTRFGQYPDKYTIRLQISLPSETYFTSSVILIVS